MIRNPPVQERSRQSLERVLAAAGEAFDAYGIDGCSMDEIARRAGVSIGALYRFFPSRPALVDALVERYRDQHEEIAFELYEPKSLARPAAEIIGDFFSRFSDLTQTQPGWQGLTRAGRLFGGHATDQWTRRLEQFLSVQVPRLDPLRRKTAAVTFQALTGWLLLHAVNAESGVEGPLREAHTVLDGYVNELRRECN